MQPRTKTTVADRNSSINVHHKEEQRQITRAATGVFTVDEIQRISIATAIS